MKKVFVQFEGQNVEVFFVKKGRKFWCHFLGKTYLTEERQARGGRSLGFHSGLELKAPMPGKILQVFLKPGQKVSEGQEAVVLEAMKMEYTLKVSQPGEVKKVYIQVGEQVSEGKTLVELS